MLRSAALLLACALLPAPAATLTPAAAFERLKGLAGTWTGTGADGATSRYTYEVVAGGTALYERCEMPHEGGTATMITLFHLDGERLLLTHYCVAGNQPRMEARALTDEAVTFEFADSTGLDKPEEGHMHRAVFRFDGPDRFTTEWTFRAGGKDVFTETETCTRDAR
jgi:hypothetical protein